MENKTTIKGAMKIVSSVPSQAVVQTTKSLIIFTGLNIEVKKLDLENEEVVLEGTILNVKFTHKGEKQSFLRGFLNNAF